MNPSPGAAPEALTPAEALAPHLRTAVIVPAYNEAGRITSVLRSIAAARLVDEIIVVTDGCLDSTADEARGFAARLMRGEVKALGRASGELTMIVHELGQNIGKGGAMTYGALRTEAEILLFLDSDLLGLIPAHVDSMLAPMLRADTQTRADMTLGLFGGAPGGVVGWLMNLCHRKASAITGQRAIRREVYLAVPGLTRSRFGVETAITRYVRHAWKLRVEDVGLYGVTHPLKEEKIGIFRGFKHRASMYFEIAAYLAYDSCLNRTSSKCRADTMRMREYFSDRS